VQAPTPMFLDLRVQMGRRVVRSEMENRLAWRCLSLVVCLATKTYKRFFLRDRSPMTATTLSGRIVALIPTSRKKSS